MTVAAHPRRMEFPTQSFTRRWYFAAIALVMLLVATAAFLPSIAQPAGRRAPLSLLAAVHGIVFFTWLLIFLAQTSLVASRHIGWHKRLGIASIAVFAMMPPLAWATTLAMVRRGVDLSGDLSVAIGNDVAATAVFPMFNTLIFAVLVVAALSYRHRPEIHQRLMLFANIELMPAPLTHLIGHSPVLAGMPGAIVMVPLTLFVLGAIAGDLLRGSHVHRLTWWLAGLRMISGFLEAGPIGGSAKWHEFLAWLAH